MCVCAREMDVCVWGRGVRYKDGSGCTINRHSLAASRGVPAYRFPFPFAAYRL